MTTISFFATEKSLMYQENRKLLLGIIANKEGLPSVEPLQKSKR
jgi:hypothetical protein